jgi:hypothetical protein
MYVETPTLESLVAAAPDVDPVQSPLLVLLAPAHMEIVPALCEAFRRQGRRLMGGVFPGLIAHTALHRQGAIIEALPPGFVIARADLAGETLQWLDAPPSVRAGERAGALILLDATAPRISAFLADIFDRWGNRVTCCGGGAGQPDLAPLPAVFTEAGWLAQGGLVAVGPSRVAVEVRHGWRRLGPAFVATRTRGAEIEEINWEPAAAFYRNLVGGLDPAMRTAPFYPDINGRFPLAMSRSGNEDVVRDPVRETPSGGVLFLSDVPENSVLHVMAATPEAMLTAASEGAVRLAERVSTGCPLILDCGSRANALGDRFVEELERVRHGLGALVNPEVGLLGMLVLGEIASDGEGRIELYNKTLVLAAFHD